MPTMAGIGLGLLLGSMHLSAASVGPPAAGPVEPAHNRADFARPVMPDCTLPEGWASIDQRNPDFVIFGEIHGTRQSPAFVGRVACSLAASGKKLLIGVEFDAGVDSRFQAAWALPHSQFADALGAAGWSGRRDGVASKAMFQLLVDLHALKAAGAEIGIAAFNGEKDDEQRRRFAKLPGQGPHEAAQAENIVTAFHASKYDMALILVGGLHARKRAVEAVGVMFEPMAMRLVDAGAVISLRMKSAGGAAWNCGLKAGYKPEPGKPIRDDAIDCADHQVLPDPDFRGGPHVSLAPDAKQGVSSDYDGYFWVGEVSGSPPAIPVGK